MTLPTTNWAGSLDVTKTIPDSFSSSQQRINTLLFSTPQKKDFNQYFQQKTKPKAFVTTFFGDTASGKTFDAMTFPQPIYFIDTENRAISTKYYNFKDKEINIFEPVQLKTQFKENDWDSFDTYKTIQDINKFIIDFANEVKEGKITKGTLVVDSVTDIWSWIQDWAVTELSKKLTSKGSKRADELTGEFNTQFDWKVPNKKHFEMMGVLRSLINHGIYIVFTARERETPDYIQQNKVQSMKDLIRSHKDIPFMSDVTIYLRKVVGQQTKYWANIIKLSGKTPPTDPIENITFEKINNLLEG